MDPRQQQQQQQQQNAFAVVKGVGEADVALASLCTQGVLSLCACVWEGVKQECVGRSVCKGICLCVCVVCIRAQAWRSLPNSKPFLTRWEGEVETRAEAVHAGRQVGAEGAAGEAEAVGAIEAVVAVRAAAEVRRVAEAAQLDGNHETKLP